jgi:hypothetical protein
MQGVKARIGLAVPGRPMGPWSRRTGAPKPSATGRDRKTLAAPRSRLANDAVVTEDGPQPFSYWEPTALRRALSSSPAVPLACHSQQSRPVPSGQPRTTPRRPQPAPFAKDAGSQHSRSGFGSRGSPPDSLSPISQRSDKDKPYSLSVLRRHLYQTVMPKIANALPPTTKIHDGKPASSHAAVPKARRIDTLTINGKLATSESSIEGSLRPPRSRLANSIHNISRGKIRPYDSSSKIGTMILRFA